MDWSKAKSVLIIALIITNILMASLYFGELYEEQRARDAAAANAAAYLSSCGVELNCDIPSKDVRLPVLFVTFSGSADERQMSYKGYPVELTGEGFGVPSSYSTGGAEGSVASASSAVISFVSGLSQQSSVQTEGLVIDSIELVYWINRSAFSASVAEDTAVPAWKISTSSGVFYVNAFSD